MYSDLLATRFRTILKSVGQMQVIKLVDEGEGEKKKKMFLSWILTGFFIVSVHSASAVVSFLRFVYYGEVKMDPIDACEMIHKVCIFFFFLLFVH